MPARPKSPSAQRRLIALTLRELRVRAGMDMKEVVAQLDRNISWLSRAERAEMTPSTGDLKELLRIYELDPEGAQAQAMLSVARLARKRGGWWHSYTEYLPKDFGDFVGMETAASLLSEYESVLIPGLLQTEEYSRALMLAGGIAPRDAEVREKLTVRAHRQRLLDADDPPDLRVVVDEGAVRREVGGAKVMRAQIEHLIEMATRPFVKIQVLPYRSGAHPGMDGPFTVIDFPPPPEGYVDLEQPRLIYIESKMNAWYLEKPEEIIAYDAAWDELRSLALTPNDTIGLLRKIADGMTHTE